MAPFKLRLEPPTSCHFALFVIMALVLCGGATSGWPRALALAATGLLLILDPPRRSPGKLLDVAAVGLMVVALVAFMPVFTWARESWWVTATEQFGIALPKLHAAQPWLSIEALLLMVCGFGWFYMAASWTLSHRERKQLLWRFSVYIALLAGGVMAGTFYGWKYPFAQDVHNFSYFPNRNQTSCLLAMGGVVSFGLSVVTFRRQKALAAVTILCTFVILLALVYSLSRAGILLFFGGCSIWLLFNFRVAGNPRFARLAVPLLILLFSFFLFYGEGTLDRVIGLVRKDASDVYDFRTLIYSDTWQMIKDQPLSGTGIGNFAGVFPQYREASTNFQPVIHPESDWLWVWAELGLFGLLFLGLGAGALIAGIAPIQSVREARYRIIAAAAVVVLLTHSLVDVSGHRLGTAMAASFLYGLARAEGQPGSTRALWMSPGIWRIVGAGLLAVGLIWGAAFILVRPWYTDVVLNRGEKAVEQVGSITDSGEALSHLNQAVSRAPMKWRPYFNRARFYLYITGNQELAMQDFSRARFLAPHSADVAYYEGLHWMPFQPAAVVSAWRDALNRKARNYDRKGLYRQMLRIAGSNPRVYEGVYNFSFLDPELRTTYLFGLRGEEFLREIRLEVAESPLLEEYSSEMRSALFYRWVRSGDPAGLLQHLDRYPGLVEDYWQVWAPAKAALGDYSIACTTYRKHLTVARIPVSSQHNDVMELKREFTLSQSNLVKGVNLLNRQIELEDWSGAGKTIQLLIKNLHVPPYIHYWNAIAKMETGRYRDSWEAWLVYAQASGLIEQF